MARITLFLTSPDGSSTEFSTDISDQVATEIMMQIMCGQASPSNQVAGALKYDPDRVDATMQFQDTHGYGTFSDSTINKIMDVREEFLKDRGRKIQAIKALRNLTGWGLKEAKDEVDDWAF